MNCDTVQAWIWETSNPRRPPDPAVDFHLSACAACSDELAARRALAADLASLRVELEEAPSAATDGRVLAVAAAAVESRQSGSYAPVRPIRPDLLPATGPVTLDAAPPVAARPNAPVATPSWMLAAAALLGFALLAGFVAGRATGPGGLYGSPALHTTLASTSWQGMHRPHQVAVPAALMEQIGRSQTYVMTGPVGGPYEVVGRLRVEEVGLDATLPLGTGGEVVLAVSPGPSWQQGEQLALNDLAEPGVEILGRRRLDRGRPAPLPTAP